MRKWGERWGGRCESLRAHQAHSRKRRQWEEQVSNALEQGRGAVNIDLERKH